MIAERNMLAENVAHEKGSFEPENMHKISHCSEKPSHGESIVESLRKKVAPYISAVSLAVALHNPDIQNPGTPTNIDHMDPPDSSVTLLSQPRGRELSTLCNTLENLPYEIHNMSNREFVDFAMDPFSYVHMILPDGRSWVYENREPHLKAFPTAEFPLDGMYEITEGILHDLPYDIRMVTDHCVQHIETTPPTINVRLLEGEGVSGRIEFELEDEGVGLESAQFEVITEDGTTIQPLLIYGTPSSMTIVVSGVVHVLVLDALGNGYEASIIRLIQENYLGPISPTKEESGERTSSLTFSGQSPEEFAISN